jgi:hypothetical protein
MKMRMMIILWLFSLSVSSQVRDTVNKTIPTSKPFILKPEVLSSGFIDIINNGQINASARFIRLFVGEPGKLTLPVSIYSGVSSNNFQNQQTIAGFRNNDHLVNGFINPLAGLINICMEGILYANKKIKITRTGFLYHNGIRILTGYKTGSLSDPSTGRPINFLNSFGAGGLFFQTGAWEKNNSKNVGMCWLAFRYILCKSSPKQLNNIFPLIETKGFYHGWSMAGGIEINNLVNIKLVYYSYVQKPEMDYTLPIYQFSFNYSLR